VSLWKAVVNELELIKAALAAVPPDIARAQQVVEALAEKLKNRKARAPRTFTIDELMKAVEHLAFEMQQFRCYSKLYKDGDLDRLYISRAASQAVRYALLLHLRLLIDFFYGEAEQDDCNVAHFNVLDGFEAAFPASLHVANARIKKLSVNLNKLLAHLTATRWESGRPPMKYYAEFLPNIEDLISRFENALPKGVQQVFLEHFQDWERSHPARSPLHR
jgi:hypothetical protein